MGQRSVGDNRAASTITDERVNDDWNPNDKRFLRNYRYGDEKLLIKELDIRGKEARSVINDIKFNVERGTCYTFIVDNTILAIAGVMIARPGIGELWSVSTNRVKRNSKFYFEASRWGIEDGFKHLSLRRLQTFCRRDDSISYNWQKRLGFELEGIMKSYNDDGTDAVRMAMVWRQRKTLATV